MKSEISQAQAAIYTSSFCLNDRNELDVHLIAEITIANYLNDETNN